VTHLMLTVTDVVDSAERIDVSVTVQPHSRCPISDVSRYAQRDIRRQCPTVTTSIGSEFIISALNDVV